MAHVLAYDAGCGPCTSFKNVIEFLDAYGKMRYLPLSEVDSEGLLDALPPALRFASFHMIGPGGSVTSGSNAIPEVVSLLPGGRVLGWVLRMNPAAFRSMALVYSILSRLHGSGSCSRDDPHASTRGVLRNAEDGPGPHQGRYLYR